MSDNVYIGQAAKDFSTSPELPRYTKVIINIDDDSYVEAGSGTNVLELTCPWGTRQMAKDILSSVSSFDYRPYDTEWAIIDPAVELGDGVTINSVFSGVYRSETDFSTLMAARISAPQDNAVDHEYPYKSKADRETKRKFAETRASLRVNADNIAAEVVAREESETEMRAALELHSEEIAARVTRTGGDSTSFGWSLTADGFVLDSGGQTVFKVDKTGAVVTGEIRAESGYIGSEYGGFTITSDAIYNSLSSLYGSAYGVYIGTDGIALGGNFRVDSAGNLYATSGTFTGTVYANQIAAGGNAGYISGAQIGSGTITGGYYGNIANGTVAYGNTAFTSTLDQVSTNAANIAALQNQFLNVLTVQEIRAGAISLGGYGMAWHYSDSRWWVGR